MPMEFQTISSKPSILEHLLDPLHHHLYQFYFTCLIPLKLWGNMTRASYKFPFFSFSFLPFLTTLHINMLSMNWQDTVYFIYYSASQRRKLINTETQITALLPDPPGSAFTCRFCQFLSFCYIADNCYSSDVYDVHLSPKNYGRKATQKSSYLVLHFLWAT